MLATVLTTITTIWRPGFTEPFAITDMTVVITGAVLFRSESKGDGFNANERP